MVEYSHKSIDAEIKMSEFENHEINNSTQPELTVFQPVNDVALDALLRLVEITKKISPERVSQLFSPEDPERKYIEQMLRDEQITKDREVEAKFIESLKLVEDLNAVTEIESFDPETEKVIAEDESLNNHIDVVPSGINAFGKNIKELNAEKIKRTRNHRLGKYLLRVATFNQIKPKEDKLSA